MPEIKGFDDVSKVESFMKKYTGKNNFENHTISVETFIKELNKKQSLIAFDRTFQYSV